MLDARSGRVGDRRRLRHAHAQHAAGRARVTRPHADEHALGAGSHQVQSGLVRGATTDERRDRNARDELLQVERLPVRRDMLGRDDCALNDEHVEPGLQGKLVVVADTLRRERAGGEHARALDLLDPRGDQLRLDRAGIDLLEPPRRLVLRELGDALELGVGILVARVDALEVEDAEAAELAELDRRRGRDHGIHCRADQRELEQVRA